MKGSMKAALALIVIYIAAFIIATQGGSQNPVQASASGTNVPAGSKSVDPEKEADLRSLLQYVGAKDQLQSVASESATQYREKLSASVKNVADDSEAAGVDYGGFGQLSEEFRPATGSAANRGDLRQAFY